MSRSERSSDAGLARWSCPGKILLLGEYAVLAEKPALICAIGPRFALEVAESDGLDSPFHPDSPAGRLLARSGIKSLRLRFDDPFAGQGGFGASTAQFALAYAALAPRCGWDADWASCWKTYRELASREQAQNDEIPPSGADLAVQCLGGAIRFETPGPEARALAGFESVAPNLLVFSTTGKPGRKVATHEHLRELARSGFPAGMEDLLGRLEACAVNAIDALAKRDAAAFGRTLDRYADLLSLSKLESDEAREDRIAFRELPGVLGAKGAGALLSDAAIVLVDEDARERVKSLAESRGLRLVADGIRVETGILHS